MHNQPDKHFHPEEIEMAKEFKIKGSFSVQVTLRVPASDFDEALNKVCNKEIFTTFCGSPETFGFDENVLENTGIIVEVDGCDGDPSPTGRAWTDRAWEWSGPGSYGYANNEGVEE